MTDYENISENITTDEEINNEVINNEVINVSYYQSHKTEISLQKKEYYKKNKERLLNKVVCKCGSITSANGILRHNKTLKHIKYIEGLQQNKICKNEISFD
tara:strand:- start:9448 stop:9750 length:303 start_codon:yes stop_codon:yes gene_type:complete